MRAPIPPPPAFCPSLQAAGYANLGLIPRDRMNPYMNDRSALMLPHPVRVDAALGQSAEHLVFAATGMMDAIRPHLTEETSITEWIINTVPGMQEMAMLSLGAPNATVYIELARPSPLRIVNRESGLHAVEGAYVTSHRIPPGARLLERADRVRGLRLNPEKETPVLELVLTGFPAGKAHVLDDASQDIVLSIQDEDEPLGLLLERHNAYYLSAWVIAQPGFVLPEDNEVARAGEVIDLLAKVLLYLNLAEAEQLWITERSDRERRLRGLGPKKAKRYARQLATAYDRILIGSRVETQT
jgi:hypothetical protein